MRGAIAQRLVRKICDNCKEERKPTKAEQRILAQYGIPENQPLFQGRGCEICNRTGYKGRIGVFESFASNPEVEEMIIKGVKDTDIKNFLISRGMQDLIHDGFEKVKIGLSTLEEVERSVAI